MQSAWSYWRRTDAFVGEPCSRMLVQALGVQGKGLRSLRFDIEFIFNLIIISNLCGAHQTISFVKKGAILIKKRYGFAIDLTCLSLFQPIHPLICIAFPHSFTNMHSPPISIYNNLMSDQQSPNQDAIIIKDKQQQRKYGCPCGKWYLSYPALFTHVKQKHDGKPPGSLIKPKTDKARGRPRLPTSNVQEDQSILNYDCIEQLEKVLLGKSINYHAPFEKSFGHETCQDMATEFSSLIAHEGQQRKIINCFLNYLKFFVQKKYENNYWQEHKPTDIIDISNEIVRNLENHKEMFPLEKQTLIDMLYVLFRWMYKHKWTDHKLVKRSSEQEVNKENQKGVAS